MALKEKSQRRQKFWGFKDYGWHYDYFQNIIIMVYTVIKDWVYMQINNMTKLSYFNIFRIQIECLRLFEPFAFSFTGEGAQAPITRL